MVVVRYKTITCDDQDLWDQVFSHQSNYSIKKTYQWHAKFICILFWNRIINNNIQFSPFNNKRNHSLSFHMKISNKIYNLLHKVIQLKQSLSPSAKKLYMSHQWVYNLNFVWEPEDFNWLRGSNLTLWIPESTLNHRCSSTCSNYKKFQVIRWHNSDCKIDKKTYVLRIFSAINFTGMFGYQTT